MTRRRPPVCGVGRGTAGFALLLVLWTLVLIAFLVMQLSSGGRSELGIATNLEANAVAAAAADGGIAAAIFNLTAPQSQQRWPVGGPVHQLTIGNCRVLVRVENEAARINPNLASPALIAALLRVLGSDPDSAARIAAAISDWVGTSPTPKTPEALRAQYQAAGRDYVPPGAPFESIDELSRVVGVTPALYAALVPHLTLYGPADPDPNGADPVVAAALAQSRQSVPTAAPVPPDTMTLRVLAQAYGLGNARASRDAILRLSPSLPQGYAILAWRRGDAVD
jgi:general secretion pathway protein K